MAKETAEKLAWLEARLHDCAGRSAGRQVTLPPAAYHDPDWYARERARVHETDWLLLGHVSELPERGSYVCVEVLDEPLFVVRDEGSQIRVLSRVCRHRGVDLRPEREHGRTRAFVCPYHQWSYKLDGRLRHAPLMEGVQALDAKHCALKAFRHEIWQGFIFMTLDPDVRPLAARLGPLTARIANWRMAEMSVLRKQDWPAPWNWKLMVENFIEGYHHIGTHGRSLEPIWPAASHVPERGQAGSTLLRFPNSDDYLARRVARRAEGFGAIPSLTEEDLAASLVISVLPSLTGFLIEDRAYVFRILPTGPDSTSLTTYELLHPDMLEGQDAEEKLAAEFLLFDRFHEEDLALLEKAAKGLKSRAAGQGPLSPYEASIWDLQRYLSDKFRGREA